MSQAYSAVRRGLLLLGLLAAGCDGGGAAAPGPSPVPTSPAVVGLTCAVGSADCSSVMLGQTVTFTARRTDGADVRSASLEFGDGGSVGLGGLASPAQVSHEYSRTGTFTARLALVTATGEAKASTEMVQVGTLVTASIGATDLGGLNALATADVQGAVVVRYEWTFDPNAGVVITTGPQARFVYPAPGYKAVELRAVLADGRTIRASGHVVME